MSTALAALVHQIRIYRGSVLQGQCAHHAQLEIMPGGMVC